MNLQDVLFKIQNFNINGSKDEFEILHFFDDIGSSIDSLILTQKQERQIIIALFDYLKRQEPEVEENWSFIHLIECFDRSNSLFYNKLLQEHCEEFPSTTSLLLLNRYINSVEKGAIIKPLNILEEISLNQENSALIREIAQEYLDYQRK